MELDTILNLMITYNLTADELLLVYLTFLAREEEGHPEYIANDFVTVVNLDYVIYLNL